MLRFAALPFFFLAANAKETQIHYFLRGAAGASENQDLLRILVPKVLEKSFVARARQETTDPGRRLQGRTEDASDVPNHVSGNVSEILAPPHVPENATEAGFEDKFMVDMKDDAPSEDSETVGESKQSQNVDMIYVFLFLLVFVIVLAYLYQKYWKPPRADRKLELAKNRKKASKEPKSQERQLPTLLASTSPVPDNKETSPPVTQDKNSKKAELALKYGTVSQI